jgi:hypothetical protein
MKQVSVLLFFQKASKGIGGGSHQKNQPKPVVAH